MQLNDLYSAPGVRRKKYRPGRGTNSDLSKTGGCGHRGLTSRSGGEIALGFEDGQQPLHHRLPKFGFVSLKAMDRAEVRTSELTRVESDVVGLQILRDANLINQHVQHVKVILSGEAGRTIALRGIVTTKGAHTVIEATSGKFEDQMAK